MYRVLREEDAMMSSLLGGGFDALRTPLMSQGEEDSVDESKMPDPIAADAGDSGKNDPHGDASHVNVAQAVSDIQCSDDDAQDWNVEILNHVLVNILDEEQVDADATGDFAVFVIANGIDDVRIVLTVSEDDFNLMGHNVDFKTFQALQALNKMPNKEIADATSDLDETLWFLGLEKSNVMRHMLRNKKVTMMPSAASGSVPSVPLGRLNSDKVKLETA